MAKKEKKVSKPLSRKEKIAALYASVDIKKKDKK